MFFILITSMIFSACVFVSLMYIIANLCMQVNGELIKIYAGKLANSKYFITFTSLVFKFAFLIKLLLIFEFINVKIIIISKRSE